MGLKIRRLLFLPLYYFIFFGKCVFITYYTSHPCIISRVKAIRENTLDQKDKKYSVDPLTAKQFQCYRQTASEFTKVQHRNGQSGSTGKVLVYRCGSKESRTPRNSNQLVSMLWLFFREWRYKPKPRYLFGLWYHHKKFAHQEQLCTILVILSDKQEEEYQKALHKHVFPAQLSVSSLPSPLAAIDGTDLSNLQRCSRLFCRAFSLPLPSCFGFWDKTGLIFQIC